MSAGQWGFWSASGTLDVQNWSSQSITHVVYLAISAQATVLPPGRAQLDLRELAPLGYPAQAAVLLLGRCGVVWRRWRRRIHGTLSPLVHGLSVVLLRGCLRVGARALLEGCSKLAAAVCSVLHWYLARIMCSFSRGLCLGPHLRSQPRHAWPFRRARFVGPYVRPPLYSAVLVPASAAMWRCCECWVDSMQRACFPLPGIVSTPHVGWWPSK